MFDFIINEFLLHGFIPASTDRNVIKCLASDYGVPQNRERVFVVASNNIYGDNNFKYPEPTHGEGRKYPVVTVEDALRYLPEINSGEGNEKQGIQYQYEEEFRKGLISEACYKYFKFISGQEGYHPSNIKHTNFSKIYNHIAVNHRPKMVKRMSLIHQGEGMKKQQRD